MWAGYFDGLVSLERCTDQAPPRRSWPQMETACKLRHPPRDAVQARRWSASSAATRLPKVGGSSTAPAAPSCCSHQVSECRRSSGSEAGGGATSGVPPAACRRMSGSSSNDMRRVRVQQEPRPAIVHNVVGSTGAVAEAAAELRRVAASNWGVDKGRGGPERPLHELTHEPGQCRATQARRDLLRCILIV